MLLLMLTLLLIVLVQLVMVVLVISHSGADLYADVVADADNDAGAGGIIVCVNLIKKPMYFK